jgi:hypothetical protein
MVGRGWSRDGLANVLLAGAVFLALYTAVVATTGGFEFRLSGVRLRSHSWIRPALAAAALAVLSGALAHRRVAALSRWTWRLLDSQTTARVLTIAAVAWVAVAGIRYGTFAVGGSDSYGYVSQAALLAQGRLTDRVPVDPSYDWYLAHLTLTPLGYAPTAEPGAIAPTYPPGLSLLMAPVWLLSPSRVYLVVPLFAALAVFLCYRLGRVLEDPLSGALAGALLSVSPVFLFQTMQPMSDVPAAACWLGAVLLASLDGRRTPPSSPLAGPPDGAPLLTSRGAAARSACAGAAASLAILIRPNLAPLAAVPLALIAWRPADGTSRLRNAVLFIAAAVPGAVTLAWIQSIRYGSPLASGYGSLGPLFSPGNIPANLEQYARWLTDTHTPFVWVCVLAPWALARGPRRVRSLAWAALVFSAGVFALYLPYVAFQRHEWTYLRFLLPAIPFMLLLAARASLSFVRQLPIVARAPLTLVLFGAVAVYCGSIAERRHAFELRAAEQRYADAGEFVRQRLPANAIVLAGQHSGSVRFYGGRPILRFDLVQPQDLDHALAALRATGRTPFMVIDPWERDLFYQRFSAPYQQTLGTARLIRVVANVQIYAFD